MTSTGGALWTAGRRRQAAALFTASLAAGWARGMDGLRSPEESQRAQKQVLCGDPRALPLQRTKAFSGAAPRVLGGKRRLSGFRDIRCFRMGGGGREGVDRSGPVFPPRLLIQN